MCICAGFYEDDMLPWVLPSIHIQRMAPTKKHRNQCQTVTKLLKNSSSHCVFGLGPWSVVGEVTITSLLRYETRYFS
jgi:hypothetical protein